MWKLRAGWRPALRSRSRVLVAAPGLELRVPQGIQSRVVAQFEEHSAEQKPNVSGITECTMDYTYHDIAKMIDHALFSPSLTDPKALNTVATLPANMTAPASASCPFTSNGARDLYGTRPGAHRKIGLPRASTRRPSRWRKRSKPWTTAAGIGHGGEHSTEVLIIWSCRT